MSNVYISQTHSLARDPPICAMKPICVMKQTQRNYYLSKYSNKSKI